MIYELLAWCLKTFGIEFKWLKKQRKEYQLITAASKRLEALEQQRKTDVEQSIRHDQDIKKDLANLADTVEAIRQKLDLMEDKNDANERAKLKDRIAQMYRRHSETREWTSMEEEAFRDLISDYELHGGKNSFVHSVCEPESYSWKIKDH